MSAHVLILLFTVPFYGIWRRWFGGNSFGIPKLRCHRGYQVVVYMAITIPLVYFLVKGFFASTLSSDIAEIVSWVFAFVFAITTYIFFWSRGHGACFDEGRGIPSESSIKRYNERWFHYVCDWIVPKEHWYGFLYDFLYMGLRYTFPCVEIWLLFYIPTFFGYNTYISAKFIFIGLMVSPIYAVSHTLKEREGWIFTDRFWITRAHYLGEWLTGFVFGLFPLCLP